MKFYSLEKKIFLLLLALVSLVIINVFGMLEIAKTSYFMSLEREYMAGSHVVDRNVSYLKSPLIGPVEINEIIHSSRSEGVSESLLFGLKTTLQQAKACSNALNLAEEALFYLFGFEEVIAICEQALSANNSIINKTVELQHNPDSKSEYLQSIEQYLPQMERYSSRFNELIPQVRHSLVNAVITFSVVFSIALVLGFFKVLKTIRGNLESLQIDINQIEQQNHLNYIVKVKNNDEIGSVAKSFQKLIEKFKALIQKVSETNLSLAKESDQLKKLALQSNQSVTEQFEMTKQVSAAIEHMTIAINEVANNISQVAKNTGDVDDSANKGQEVVSNSIKKLKDLVAEVSTATTVVKALASSSEQVDQVVDVITQIADQTNLLAINAAIEAARAGEHGKGFAAVSEQVRTLANKTRQSTREISSIIENLKVDAERANSAMLKSQRQALDTMSTAEGAGDMLNDITDLSRKISKNATQVAVTAEEQTAVLQGINNNVVTLGDVAHNAKIIANKTNNAAEVLDRNVVSMSQLVKRFKV